jgi:hypothetical protein
MKVKLEFRIKLYYNKIKIRKIKLLIIKILSNKKKNKLKNLSYNYKI